MIITVRQPPQINRRRLGRRDFLNVPGRKRLRTRPSVTRHPGSGRTFRDIRVPKPLETERNIKKISASLAMTALCICGGCAADPPGRIAKAVGCMEMRVGGKRKRADIVYGQRSCESYIIVRYISINILNISNE